MPQLQGVDIRQYEVFLALELILHQAGQHLEVHVQQRSQRADITHVLEQQPLPGIVILLIADACKRQADDGDVVAMQPQVQRFGAVIDKVSAGEHLTDILRHALRIHGQRNIDPSAAPEIPFVVDPHLVPRGQPLDIGRKNIFR